MTPADQADAVIAFYTRLTDGKIPADAALLLSIDFNKGLMTGSVKPEKPDVHEARATIDEAAAKKREAREARLAAQR